MDEGGVVTDMWHIYYVNSVALWLIKFSKIETVDLGEYDFIYTIFVSILMSFEALDVFAWVLIPFYSCDNFIFMFMSSMHFLVSVLLSNFFRCAVVLMWLIKLWKIRGSSLLHQVSFTPVSSFVSFNQNACTDSWSKALSIKEDGLSLDDLHLAYTSY